MHCVRKLAEQLYWVGGSDRRLTLFENAFPIPRGISYNAYLLLDEKTVLLDTVDTAIGGLFFENLAQALQGRPLDYLVVSHMEPDHGAMLGELCLRYPNAQIVCTAKSAAMIAQFFNDSLASRIQVVGEKSELCAGGHTLTFLTSPMVHWPEVMVTYEKNQGILFSADAFGTFGAISGHLFADEVEFERDWLPDARRYYANIVGKYGPQVQALLGKLTGADVRMLCPLHGPVWRKDIDWYLRKYQLWSTYQPEESSVLIVYGSIYGHTENAADILAAKLARAGAGPIAMYDVSAADPSLLVAEAFRCSHIVLCSVTHNGGIFHTLDHLLSEWKDHNLQNRTVSIVENGSWAPAAGSLLRKRLDEMKNMRVLERTVTLLSALKPEQEEALGLMAEEIVHHMAARSPKPAAYTASGATVDSKAFSNVIYGLFALFAGDGQKENGCIVNTLFQVTNEPKRVAVTVNKQNFTHDLIMKTGIFNLSILTEDAPFSLFRHFGFQSGRTADKFAGRNDPRSANGLPYLGEASNTMLSGKVLQNLDCGTHTLFLADVTETRILSDMPSASYGYYFEHIKPKPQPEKTQKRGFVCKICAYFYEGETLPPDFVCPICKHGAADFTKS